MSSSLRLTFCAVFFLLIGRAFAAEADGVDDEDLFDAAVAENRAGDFAEAEKSFTEYLRRRPKVPDAYYLRGFARYRLGKLAEAETDYDVFVSLEPQQARGFVMRGEVRLERGDVAGAIADATLSLRLENRPRALRVRSRAFIANRDYEAALKDLDLALEWDGSDDEARAMRSECYISLGRIEEARTNLEEILERNPDDSYFTAKLGDVLFHLQQFDEALNAYVNVVHIDEEEESYARDMMGFCHYAMGRHEKAIDVLEQAIEAKGPVSPTLGAVMHLSWKAAKRAGPSPLEELLPRIEDPWGNSICRMLLKQLGEDELIDLANAGKTVEQCNGRLCEAYFYLGAARLLQGDRIGGRAMLSEAVGTDSRTVVEYTVAKVDLARSKTK